MRAHILAVAEHLSADHATYGALLSSGALQGTLDLLERSSLNADSLMDPSIAHTKAGREAARRADAERRSALQILANLIRHDVSLHALFEDHPALDGVVLPAPRAALPAPSWDAIPLAPEYAGPGGNPIGTGAERSG